MSIKELILAGLLAAAIPHAFASQTVEEPAEQAQGELSSVAQEGRFEEQDPAVMAKQFLDSLHPQTGKVVIGDNLATLNLPKQFVFLDSAEAERVLTEAWGNPPSEPLPMGMILPAGISPLAGEAWAMTIEYEENGYVSDEDAADIDYEEMLKGMQEDSVTDNQWRSEQGYEQVQLIGWAAAPHYDADGKKLYWAKELKFGEAQQHTLNYNIRVLGRQGVLVLNFIADMNQLADIEQNLPGVLAMTEFNDGHRYADFNPELDKVAAYGLGALIAGKVAAKVGLLAGALLLLKKFWFILIGGGIWLFNRLRGKKAQVVPVTQEADATAPAAVAEPLANEPLAAPATTVLDLNQDQKPPQA